MIEAEDAISTARTLLETPYSKMDCIALIRAVIRRSAGGVKDYRCEGTNWLWRSIDGSGKYRHLIWRQENIGGARGGMLAFKRKGEDIHHVGLVTEKGTVIHASSAAGNVVETPLDGSWSCLGQHRYIKVSQEETAQADEYAADESSVQIVVIDSAGRRFVPVGDWRVLIGSED